MLKKISIDSVESRIKKYLCSNNISKPLLINVNNLNDYHTVKDILGLYAGMERISAYCHQDDFVPNLEEFYEKISNMGGDIFVVGVTQYLYILGDEELKKGIYTMLGIPAVGKIIVLCYQIESYLENIYKQDLRLERQICLIDGLRSSRPQLVFVNKEISNKSDLVIGIKNAFVYMENADTDHILIATSRRKKEFPEAMLQIQEISNVFDSFSMFKYSFITGLTSQYGTDDQWAYLLDALQSRKTLERVLECELGNSSLFEILFSKWDLYNDTKKWLFFIGIKVNGVKGNEILQRSADIACNINEFQAQIYRSILEISVKDSKFIKLYQERKALLKSIEIDLKRIVEYCNFTEMKGREAIYYLTDNTAVERIKVIECLSKFDYSKQEILDVLKVVYPDMYSYLSDYHFGISLLDDYFNTYKFQKITNRIYPEFLKYVYENAEKREYLAVLPYRSEKIESIGKEDSLLFFVDALGVEFLGYIMEKCKDMGLNANVTVCHSNLPSITSLNKEFLQEYDNNRITSIKELDEILHHGKEDFDYQKQKYPIHLIRELEIINEFLENASYKIMSGDCSKVIVVADHGASRLAVISEGVCDFEVDSKGTHGGRCCAYNEQLSVIPYAIHEGDYYVLASYDRFRGGRAASVETHGGATLEEVCVPIIELQKKMEVEVVFTSTVIKVSMRKKAEIEIFSNIILSELSIKVNGKFYSGNKIGDRKFTVQMPDIRKAGDYKADIYSNNNIIASGLHFCVEKEGFAEKDFF